MKITEVPVFFMHYCSSPSTESVSEYCIDITQSQGEESYGSYYLIQWYDDDDDDVRQQQKTLITPLVHFHDVFQEEL